ncbi:MFS transporter [uncultured Jatrophihabitans sp.]|uniref:MFS transporter n=1 Tax=uncultured Jatrophihabitans sp. TaxID=1610747 RepID=UPI0035CA63EA
MPRPVRQSLVLACICACTVLVVGFVAAINLAVPKLAASGLDPSSSQLLWIVDAYVVLFACLVIPAGALGDRYGRKGVLLAGLTVFAVGAVVSALAANVPVMLAGRAVTGIGAAGVLPNGLAVLVHATVPRRRPHAIAVWAAMSGVGGVIGNVGGGALLSIGSWRWLFAAVAPVAALCAVWVARTAPRSERHQRALDPVSALLLTLATLALLVGIIQGPEQGWGSVVVVAAFAVSAALFTTWVLGALRAPEPLLDPRLFRIPALRAACLGMLVVFFGMFGLFFLNASLLQYGRGFGVLQAGLGIVPLTVPLLVGARRVPALVARIGQPAVLAAAFVVTAAGLWGLATAIDDPYAVYALWLVVIGGGITLALPSLTIAISAALPREQAGVAGGLQATTRELGSALGVAVVGTLLTAQFVHHLSGRVGGRVPHTVAAALATDPGRHPAVIGSYTAAAGTALKIVSVIVLVAGAAVVVETVWAARRARRRHPDAPA